MAVITYQCPNCGGDLRFDPETQKYRCEYCRSDFEQETMTALEKEQKDRAMPTEPAPESGSRQPEEGTAKGAVSGEEPGAVCYTCPSCGAEIVTDEHTTATFCYYCHNPVVLAGEMQGEYLPDCVLPFAIDKDRAIEIFEQWISKKKYVPRAFYVRESIEKISGVYFPCWLYSCQVDGKLEADGLKLRTWTAGDFRYTETAKYDVARSGQMQVSRVTRNALSKASRELVEGVLPYEMEKLQPFRTGYLSGFMAQRRDMEKEQFEKELKTEVQSFAEESLRSQICGYDRLEVRSQSLNIENEQWQYGLMPVWTLTYRDPKQDKMYYFACNGQTGKVCGQLPTDRGRLAALFGVIAGPLFLGLLLAGYLI